jgi:hypothetical protein
VPALVATGELDDDWPQAGQNAAPSSTALPHFEQYTIPLGLRDYLPKHSAILLPAADAVNRSEVRVYERQGL